MAGVGDRRKQVAGAGLSVAGFEIVVGFAAEGIEIAVDDDWRAILVELVELVE